MNNKLIKQVISSNSDIVYPRTVADAILMTDNEGNPTTLQDVLDNIGPISGSANAVAIVDAGGYFIGSTVETALQEVGFALVSKAPITHNHNTLYYTKQEVNDIISALDITANQVNLTNGINSTDITQGDTGVIFDSILYGGAYRLPRIYVQETTTMPETMQNGDLLLVKSTEIAFSEVTNFPQNFGTTHTWEERGAYTSTTEALISWSSMTSTNNPIIKAIHTNGYYLVNPPHIMFDGVTNVYNSMHYGYFNLSNYGTTIIQFNGRIRFKGFTLYGTGYSHTPWVNESPKSFAFYGSNDGIKWTLMYSTTAFPDTSMITNGSSYADFADQTQYYEYIKFVVRGTFDNSSPRYCIRELQFKADGYRYL